MSHPLRRLRAGLLEGHPARVHALEQADPGAEQHGQQRDRELLFERYQEDLDELCPLCPTEGREPCKLQVKLGRNGKFIMCPNYPKCRYIGNMDGTERAEPELLDDTGPSPRSSSSCRPGANQVLTARAPSRGANRHGTA